VADVITIPTSPDELNEMLNDPKQMKDIFQNPDRFQKFIRNYAQSIADSDRELTQQVKDQVQQEVGKFLRDSGASIRKAANATLDQSSKMIGAKGALYNKAAPGAQIDKDYKGSADFFQTIWHQYGSLPNAEVMAKQRDEWNKIRNSFGSTVPADGGFLIPEELRSEILKLSLETSIVRPRARVIPMSSLAVPIPAIDETSHASSVYGGFVAYWTAEGASATESQAAFGRVRLEAKKLVIYSQAPNELVADAPAFGAFLDQSLPEVVTHFEDDAFINGSGVGEPLGVLNGSGLITVTRAVADNLAWADITGVYSRMLPQSIGRAVWLAAPDVLPELLEMTISGASIPLWLTGMQGFQAPTMQILGRPLIITEKAPKLTDPGALSFVDFGHYLLGDRQAMQATSSPHYKFQTDETAYKIVERCDGRPWVNSALTPKNGGATLSPYVTVST
jgi:HK97 family phage major capsid protein